MLEASCEWLFAGADLRNAMVKVVLDSEGRLTKKSLGRVANFEASCRLTGGDRLCNFLWPSQRSA